jgi:hypothetical protein
MACVVYRNTEIPHDMGIERMVAAEVLQRRQGDARDLAKALLIRHIPEPKQRSGPLICGNAVSFVTLRK